MTELIRNDQQERPKCSILFDCSLVDSEPQDAYRLLQAPLKVTKAVHPLKVMYTNTLQTNRSEKKEIHRMKMKVGND